MSLRNSLKVMVVDDMSVSRALIVQALEEIGIQKVDTENAGSSALAKLASNPAHLILSDYNMPGMDGLDLLEAVRRNPSTRKAGFILVTGSPTADIVARGKALGLNNMIKKPFTHAGLKQAIERVVGRL